MEKIQKKVFQITKQAQGIIYVESRQNSAQVETGGVLLGLVNDHIIMEAGRPGPESLNSAISFTPDVEHDRLLLAEAKKRHPDIDYLGYWHKHPGGFDRPSNGDLQQARDTLADFGIGEYILSIIAVVSPRFNFRGFILDNPRGDFREVQLETTDEVSHGFLRTPARDFWSDPAFNFIKTTVGKNRIKEEVAGLEQAGFEVDSLRANGRAFISLRIREWELICIPPREFPLTPPRLFWKHNNIELLNLGPQLRWNSDCSLLDIVADVKKKLGIRYYARKWSRP